MSKLIKTGDYVVHKQLNQGVMLVIDDPKPCNIFELQAKYRVEQFIHIDACDLQEKYCVAANEERAQRVVLLADWRTGELRPDNWPTIIGECLKCNGPLFNGVNHNCLVSIAAGIDLAKEGSDSTHYHSVISGELLDQVANTTGSEALARKVINNTLDLNPNFFAINLSQFENNTLLVIKACPFCGGPPCVEVRQDRAWANQFPEGESTYEAHVWCHECGARGSKPDMIFDGCDVYDKEETARAAVEKWNQRSNTFGEETARLFNLERDL